MFKSGFVAIVGRPNVGKSTLLNKILKSKVSITSDKVQTTRNNIRGVLNEENYQIVFVDTPGIHKPRNEFGKMMNSSAWDSTRDVEAICFLTEANTEFGKGDSLILEAIRQKKDTPIFIVVSKCDIAKKDDLVRKLKSFKDLSNITAVVPISAETGKGLNTLLELIRKEMPEGPQYFAKDAVVDKNSEFIIGELIREQVLRKTKEEVPHGAAAEVESMIYDRKKDLWIISGIIYVERDSHKRIIIGKAGQMISKLSYDARMQAEYYLKKKVFLKLFVKVKEKWQSGKEVIRIYGYGDE